MYICTKALQIIPLDLNSVCTLQIVQEQFLENPELPVFSFKVSFMIREKRFYTRGTLKGLRIYDWLKSLPRDWLRSLN